MNPLYFIFLIFIEMLTAASFSVDHKTSYQFDIFEKVGHTYTLMHPCRPEVEMSRETVERFLTLSRHSDKRAETGTYNLQSSQISVLNKKENPEMCEKLNELNKETIQAQRNGNENSPAFNVVYYNAGDFYFVVIVPAPPSDPNVVQTGYIGLIIYDQHLNRIIGYSSI